MARIFSLPELAESVVEGEITQWLVREGETVERDAPLLEVMTDKVTVEIPSPWAGVLVEQMAKEGDVVPVGAPVARFADDRDAAAQAADGAASAAGGGASAPAAEADGAEGIRVQYSANDTLIMNNGFPITCQEGEPAPRCEGQPDGTELEPDFGPRRMGAGPGGIAGLNLRTGERKHVVSVPFQVGHIQSNPWLSGQIVFCWETGGKAPQRSWTVAADGTGLRPLYPEAPYEWVTHEAVISPNEVAFALMGHRRAGADGPGQEPAWGPAGTREKPTGLGVVRIDTGEMILAGQIPYGSGFWHVTGSPDGRFLAGDNFAREIHLIDRRTHRMMRLSAGHRQSANDHPHPSFKEDGTRLVIQSAMMAEDRRSMDICLIPLPGDWLERPADSGAGE